MVRPNFLGVCAIVKDEADYLLEWIAYHRVVGVETFLIYDNDSTDGTTELLTALENAGVCHRIGWPRSAYPASPQIHAYRHAVREHGHDFEWMAIIDADEFVVPLAADDVPTLLREKFSDAPSVVISWRVFGSCGQIEPDARPVIERFTRCAENSARPNQNVKSIVRPELVKTTFIHNHILVDGCIPLLSDGTRLPDPEAHRLDAPVYGDLQVNHYYCKSLREFERKRLRGLADSPVDSARYIRPETAFRDHDLNDLEDTAILRFLPAVRKEMAALKAKLR